MSTQLLALKDQREAKEREEQENNVEETVEMPSLDNQNDDRIEGQMTMEDLEQINKE